MMKKNIFTEQAVPVPVFREYDLPLRRTFFPLGFPLQVETNSEDVIQAAEEGWGLFAQAFEQPPIRLCLSVTDSETMPATIRSSFASREHLFTFIADLENFAVCDFTAGYGFGMVTRAVAADHPFLRYRFLTAAGLMLVGQQWLAPLHGAFVVRNGRGVLLCGDSFAGKTTLAYACSRAGWTFVTDDGTFLVRNRCDRYAVGNPYTIRFREDAFNFFPELSERMLVVRPNGKIGIEIFTSELPISVTPGCSIDQVVFLARKEHGPVDLRAYPQDLAIQEWERHAPFGTNQVRDAQKRCYQRLLGAGLWRLEYADLNEAVQRLEQLVDAAR